MGKNQPERKRNLITAAGLLLLVLLGLAALLPQDTLAQAAKIFLPETAATVTQETVTHNYLAKPPVDTLLTVLELQPAGVGPSGSKLKKNDVAEWSNGVVNQNEIAIVTMTTSEFIGKIDDVAEKYDLVYIGDCIDNMNKTKGGSPTTLYNDTTMNGLIYTNIGDTYRTDMRLAGMLNRDYYDNNRELRVLDATSDSDANQFRFSGNDITAAKMRELIAFVAAGYPVVIADALVKVEGSTASAKAERVDVNSYMYEMLDAILECGNVVLESKAKDDKIDLIPKPRIVISNEPTSYTKEIDSPASKLEPAVADGKYHLTYNFTIGHNIPPPATPTTHYDCNLYVDLNADGRFAPTEELHDLTIELGGAVVKPETVNGGVFYELTGNQSYQVDCVLPDEYVGIIPWKLEIKDNTNVNIHTSRQGYTRVAAGEKKIIRVLQVLPAGGDTGQLNLKMQRQDPTNYYYGHLFTNLDDFDVYIYTVKADALENIATDSGAPAGDADKITAIYEYLDGYTAGKWVNYTDDEKVKDIDNYPEDYSNGIGKTCKFDVLIIGFDDLYKEIGKYSSYAIVRYIKSGRSVLFTHDTTSQANVELEDDYKYQIDAGLNLSNDPAYPGYYFNNVLRDRLGLDRYGITTRPYGEELLGEAWGETIGNVPDLNAILKVGKEGDVLSTTDIESIQNYKRDVAYKPGKAITAPRETVPEVQGYTNYSLLRYGRDTDSSITDPGVDSNTYGIDTNMSTFTGRVSPINEGQITTYPFNIITGSNTDPIEIPDTHEPFYQLNMNTDDIVVWYCLSDRGSAKTVYAVSPNDVTNAYYIYNKGNITYSGVGHNAKNENYNATNKQFNSINNEYVNEAKLLVNTMIASYYAGSSLPTVSFKADADGIKDLETLYLLADETADGEYGLPANNNLKVYYQVIDNNMSHQRELKVDLYYGVDGATDSLTMADGSVVYVEKLFASSIDKNNNGEFIKSGDVMSLDISNNAKLKTAFESSPGPLMIYITVTATPEDGSAPLTSAPDVLTLTRIGLFDLN